MRYDGLLTAVLALTEEKKPIASKLRLMKTPSIDSFEKTIAAYGYIVPRNDDSGVFCRSCKILLFDPCSLER